jgi:hypothetical protein
MEQPCVFPEGKLKQIHVHQQRLRAGLPALIVRIDGSSRKEYFEWVEVTGSSRVVQPGKSLSCGAKAWMETRGEVVAGTTTPPADT